MNEIVEVAIAQTHEPAASGLAISALIYGPLLRNL